MSTPNNSSGGKPKMVRILPENLDPKRQVLNTLERLGLEPGATIVFDKEQVERGSVMPGDQETYLSTNVYGLKSTKMDVHQYHVELTKVFSGGRFDGEKRPLIRESERKVPDFTAYQNRQMHRKLLAAFVIKYPNVFGKDPDCFCYDFANTLYSLVDITAFETDMSLDAEQVKQIIDRPFKVILHLQKPADNVFNIRDVIQKNSLDLALEAKSSAIIRFLELATSRYASEHPEDHVMYEAKKTYFMEAAKFGFDSPDLGNGKYLAAGASKTVACVEGPKNKGAPGVIIDSKKTPFYASMNLLQLLTIALRVGTNVKPNQEQFFTAVKYVKRLEAFPTYGNRQSTPITLSGLSANDANAEMLEHENGKISVAQYFKTRYDITLECPHWPLAKGAKKIAGNVPMFPLELLHVADYQRVGNGNISPTDIATIVRACAVVPAVKKGEINSCYHSFSFGIDEFMRKAGLEVLDRPLEVGARILKPPQVKYANGSLYPEQNGKWRLPRTAKYVRCSSLKAWCAIFLIVPRERMSFDTFCEFAKRYYNECLNRGLTAYEPMQCLNIQCDENVIEKTFMEAREAGCEFVLLGHSELDRTMHTVIKGMERKYSLITQCVQTKTINNVLKKSPLSLENIVAKTNVKLGGHNYDVMLDNYPIDPTILFIGLGMNHPAGGMGTDDGPDCGGLDDTGMGHPKNVSVLGFAANDGVSPNEFIGNFFFSPMHRDEKLSVLDKLLEEVFERFIANRQTPPSRVILYRSGCDEGGYRSVLRYEIPVVTQMCNRYAPGAPVTVIVPSKMHSFRFFKTDINPSGRSDDQNIRPGTVLDQVVVNNAYSEFYLNSHLAIQGSAKTTKYTIISSSEKNPKLDMFERWTNALSYDFQIVTSPTSVPAPVYIALRYAERGRQIFNTFPTSNRANLEPKKGKNGTNGKNGNGKNGNGNGANGSNGTPKAPEPPAQSEYYARSVAYNFTKRPLLRDKRVNA